MKTFLLVIQDREDSHTDTRTHTNKITRLIHNQKLQTQYEIIQNEGESATKRICNISRNNKLKEIF